MSLRVLLAWSWTVVIFIVCWLPRNYLPENEELNGPFSIPHFDKLVHFGVFLIWGFLAMKAAQPPLPIRRIFFVGLVIAVLSELGQLMPFVHRDAGLDDGLTDLFGLALGMIVTYLPWGAFSRTIGCDHSPAREGRPGRIRDHAASNPAGLVLDDRHPVTLLDPSGLHTGEPEGTRPAANPAP